jgi:AAA domain
MRGDTIMAFQKPKLGSVKAKILLIGEPGSGKTYAGLTFPAPAVIDSEGSVDLFSDQFDFVSVATKSLKEAIDATNEVMHGKVLVDGQPCKTLVIDSLTSFYNTIQHASMKTDGDIGMQGWGLIKRRFGAFLDTLYTKVDVHVVATAWVKPKFTGQDKKSGEMLSDGEVLDGDRKMSYAFDLVFKLSVDEKGNRTAKCLKARGIFGKAFKQGQVIKGGFTWATIEPILAQYQDLPARAQGQSEEDVLEQDRQFLVGEKPLADHTSALRYAFSSYTACFPTTPKEEIGVEILGAIKGHFDLQEIPKRSSDVTADQLKWAGDYFAKTKGAYQTEMGVAA